MNPLLTGYAPQMQPQYAPTNGMGGMQMATNAPSGAVLDEELIQQMLALNQMQAQTGSVARQRKMADMLRGHAADAAQPTTYQLASNPKVQVQLANPFGAAASIYGSYKGGQLNRDADVREQNLGVQKQAAMRRYFDALGMRPRQQMPYMGEEGE